MSRRVRFGVPIVLAALVAAALVLRPRPPEPPPAPRPTPVRIPRVAPPSPLREPAPAQIAVAEAPLTPDPARLAEFLAALGRAAALGDRKGYRLLVESAPPIYRSDLESLAAQLASPVMMAAVGAAELLGLARVNEAVPSLAETLRRSPWVYLHRAAIQALARIGTAEARQALVSALAGESRAEVRRLLVKALAPFADDPVAASALMSRATADPDAETRRAAALAMAAHPRAQWASVLANALAAERDVRVQEALAYAVHAASGNSAEPLAAVLRERPALRERIESAVRRGGPARYDREYPAAFFAAGGERVRFDSAQNRRVGITIEVPPGRSLEEVADRIFARPPLHRYREFFYVRRAQEAEADASMLAATARAYDAWGRPIAGGVPVGELDGTVYLRFVDPASLPPGVGGYTDPTQSVVTDESAAHEFGHAFAGLGDEYSHILASDWAAANLAPRPEAPEWLPLAAQGHLPLDPPPRVELDAEGMDVGPYAIPSPTCAMNNRPGDDRYCPVCQLELIARICELSGARVPW